MKELRRKQMFKRALYSYPSLIVAAVLTFFLVKGAFGILLIERESANRVKDLEAQSLELAAREQSLQNEIEKIQTQEGIVEEIKDKFSVTREGEYMAIIIEAKNKATYTEPSGAAWLKNGWLKLKSLWQR